MRIILTILSLLSLLTLSQAKVNFSEKQLETLRFACNEGKYTNLAKGDECFLMAAIAWQESSAGNNITGGVGHQSFGVFQNYVVTVQSRLKQDGIIKSKSEIKALLMDRNYSAKFSKIELKYWFKYHKGNLTKTLASYNAGFKYSRGLSYAESIKRKMEYLKKHHNDIKPLEKDPLEIHNYQLAQLSTYGCKEPIMIEPQPFYQRWLVKLKGLKVLEYLT